MKAFKITHWILTGLFSALMVMSASMYIFNNDEIKLAFTAMGFPHWLIYPMATAKFLAVFMILTKMVKFLTEWAYAGLFFNILLAVGAHLSINDGEHYGAVVALLFVVGSYFTWKKGWPEKSA